MRRGVEQHLMLVLPVQIDQSAARLAQRRARREHAVDERAAAPLRGDLAADDHLAAVRGFEDGFDGRVVFAGAHQVGGRAAADQQADRARRGCSCRRRFPPSGR